MQILDYSQYVYDSINGMHGSRMGTAHISKSNYEPTDKKLFHQVDDVCVYCRTKMVLVHRSFDEVIDNWEQFYNIFIYVCDSCGWWHYINDQFADAGDFDHISQQKYKGLLRSFSVDDEKLPLSALNNEIKNDPKVLYEVHPRKMEELVQWIFSSYFECEVKHCGKSHDGGIDLIVVESDNPILVQVKRRQDPSFIEPISAVRDFLGAMLINESKRGLYVSTCDHFSAPVEKVRKSILEKKVVDYFETYNFDKLVSIFNLVKNDIDLPWKRIHRPLKVILHDVKNPFFKSK